MLMTLMCRASRKLGISIHWFQPVSSYIIFAFGQKTHHSQSFEHFFIIFYQDFQIILLKRMREREHLKVFLSGCDKFY